ncbi:MAG TPA: hypothetical protein VMM58_03410 [Bacteroidota bacterium]|nr:hypothetical protein [Bacteroidota bacterium]
MSRRPLPVTIISCLFIVVGIAGIAYHANEIRLHDLLSSDLMWPLCIRLLAIVGGIFLFRGMNWARWLVLAWLAFHVGLSYFHTMSEMAMHAVMLVVIAFFLFQPKVNEYIQRAKDKH